MGWLRAIGEELLGLFVDDWAYALAIACWVLVCWFAVPALAIAAPWPAVIFFAGLALILVESALRRARAARP
jgi:hypothetical protein